jgi:hypothetical protein
VRIRQATNGSEGDLDARPEGIPGRWPRLARRCVAFAVVLMIPTYVSVLVASGGPVTELPRADAAYIAEELIQADRRVRKALAGLRPLRTAAARARTREAIATVRSLTLEIRHSGGAEAERLSRALALEGDWLDAVGSTLANPRSALRDALASRDADLGPALVGLPGAAPTHREGTRELLDYARRRSAARS